MLNMTDTDKILLDQLKQNLDSLENVTIWIFAALLVIFVAKLKVDDEIEVGGIKIRREHVGIVAYSVLCALNFQILHLLQNIYYVYDTTPEKSSAILILRLHPWIFNPVSVTSNFVEYVVDYSRFSLLLFLWWFGFAIAQILFLRNNQDLGSIGIVLFGIYLVLGAGTVISYFIAFWLIKNLPIFQKHLKVDQPKERVGEINKTTLET